MIRVSSRWSGGPKPEDILMSYDLGAEFEHWLVSGRKKGTFIAKVSSISRFSPTRSSSLRHSSRSRSLLLLSLPPLYQNDEPFLTTFTLIPVHHGSLFLPRVSVQPAPSPSIPQHSIPSSETYLINAAERISVLPLLGRSTFVVGTPTSNGWGGWEGEEVGVEG